MAANATFNDEQRYRIGRIAIDLTRCTSLSRAEIADSVSRLLHAGPDELTLEQRVAAREICLAATSGQEWGA